METVYSSMIKNHSSWKFDYNSLLSDSMPFYVVFSIKISDNSSLKHNVRTDTFFDPIPLSLTLYIAGTV